MPKPAPKWLERKLGAFDAQKAAVVSVYEKARKRWMRHNMRGFQSHLLLFIQPLLYGTIPKDRYRSRTGLFESSFLDQDRISIAVTRIHSGKGFIPQMLSLI